MASSTFRHRRHGRLYFGDAPRDQWSIIDPSDPALAEALHRMRYGPDRVTEADRHLVLAAAEAYRHLTTYPLADVAVGQLRAIRRAVRRG